MDIAGRVVESVLFRYPEPVEGSVPSLLDENLSQAYAFGMAINNTVYLVEPDGSRVEHKLQSVDVPLGNGSVISIRFGYGVNKPGIAEILLYTEPGENNCIVVQAGGGNLVHATTMKREKFISE